MYSPRFHSASSNGPVPMGLIQAPSAPTESLDRMPVPPQSMRAKDARNKLLGFSR
ncbi:hypothetical protein D3C77_751160 [compost metagenome]